MKGSKVELLIGSSANAFGKCGADIKGTWCERNRKLIETAIVKSISSFCSCNKTAAELYVKVKNEIVAKIHEIIKNTHIYNRDSGTAVVVVNGVEFKVKYRVSPIKVDTIEGF